MTCWINADSIKPLVETSSSDEGIKEREDLQRILKQSIDVIAPDTLVIAEEYGEWEDSQRRIDILAVDRQARLVVIELKRTQNGGHMELQALRYAAMVSVMTFRRAVEIFQDYLGSEEKTGNPENILLDFFEWDEPSEEIFARDVRVILA